MKRVLSSISILIIASLNLGNVHSPVSAAPLCLPAPKLNATPAANWKPTAGVSVSTWNFARGVSHNGPEATRVSVATASLQNFDLIPMHNGFPNVSDPFTLMTENRAYAAINTDFFDLSWPAFAWGPVVRNSIPEYIPLVYENEVWKPGWLKVVATLDDVPSTGVGYLTSGRIRTNWGEVAVSGINLKTLPKNFAIAYDQNFVGATPKGAATIVIRSGVVVESYPSGKALEVSAGTKVIQATGTMAEKLRKLQAEPAASVRINGPLKVGFSARGTISLSSKKFPIVGVNLAKLKTGATIFNQNWKASKTPKGNLTWVVQGSKVLKVFKSGAVVKPSASTTVVQFLKPSAEAKKVKAGAVVNLSHSIPNTAKGYKTSGVVSSVFGDLKIDSINLAEASESGVQVFDQNWNNPTPAGSVTITITNGVITSLDSDGDTPQPADGEYVIQVPSALRDAAVKYQVNMSATLTLDPPSERVRTLNSTHIMSSSELRVGNDVVPIGAVNYKRISSSQATIFNQHWLGTDQNRLTPAGKATVVIRDGKIHATHPLGASVYASNADTVIQIPKSYRALVTSWTVGTPVEVALSVKTKNSKTIINAFGRGRPNLTNGQIVTACSPDDDGVRPRTSIGWNDYGQVWLITGSPTGSGLSNDGYRDGGATVHQMAEWLQQLGATDAVSFDGGGSTWMMRNSGNDPHRVDMADPGPSYDPWIRWVPISLGIVDRSD